MENKYDLAFREYVFFIGVFFTFRVLEGQYSFQRTT